ncbi:MAG TPA: anti-sigma factor antagonist [bacterium]|nr:anti-sigma factor antagonist [bacterium]
MNMSEEKKQDVLILSLGGELMGGDDARPFQERIYEAIREGNVQLVVDMQDVKWMNSSGLGILMAGLTTLRGSGGDLRLSRVPDRVRRPIEITKLDQVLRLFTSVEDALMSYEGE